MGEGGERSGGRRGEVAGGRGIQRPVLWKPFYPVFAHHKESHTGCQLWLAVWNQTVYPPIVCFVLHTGRIRAHKQLSRSL